MSKGRTGRIFRLVFDPPAQGNLLKSPRQALTTALSRGTRTERYGRLWIVGPTEERDGVLSGRIGFRGDGAIAELWDEERRDFVEFATPAGLTAPFAIDLRSLKGVVQVRPPVIRVNSLIGAFEKLLADADGRWRVRGEGRQTTLSEWKSHVEKVTAVRFSVRVPNPRWAEAPDLQSVMEDARAQLVNLDLENEDGLNLDASFVAQTEHHIERGYGEARYVGTARDVSGVHETVYSTKLGTEEVSDEVPADEQTGEVPADALRERLEGAADSEETDSGGGADQSDPRV